MERVERWQCGYCRKEFKTPDRHFCRKDPANKSCASCGNRQWEYESDDDYNDHQVPYCQYAADNEWGDCTLLWLSKHRLDWFDIRKPHFIVNCQHWIPDNPKPAKINLDKLRQRIKGRLSDVFQR